MSTKAKQANPQRPNSGKRPSQQTARTQPQQSTQPVIAAQKSQLTKAQVAASDAEKLAARQQRQAVARAAAVQQKRMAMIRRVSIFGAIAVVLLGTAGFLIWREASKPGTLVDIQASRPHVSFGQAHPAYTTDPPTSGPHVDQVPEFKVYSEPITVELQVHGLEDGAAVINYKPGLDKVTVDRLAALAETYYEKGDPDPTNVNIQHMNRVIVSPYNFKDPNDVIVLTAWRRIERLPAYDEAKIRDFLDNYAGKDNHAESAAGPVFSSP